MAEWFSKCAAGLVVFAGLISLGTTVHYRSKVTIEQYLNDIGLPILAKDSQAWSKVLIKYKDKDNKLKIDELKQEDESHLSDWCLNKAKINFNNKNKEIFLRMSAWCTEPHTIKELIEKVKKKTINKDSFKKGNCFVLEAKHFLHEEDPNYLEFIKDCVNK